MKLTENEKNLQIVKELKRRRKPYKFEKEDDKRNIIIKCEGCENSVIGYKKCHLCIDKEYYQSNIK